LNRKSHIAFFDFDGTITANDSMIEFVKFAHGEFKFYIGLFLLSPILLALKLKLINNHTAKEKFIFHFFNSYSESELHQLAEKFSGKLEKMVLPNALKKIEWHKQNNHEVVIVSASLETYLKHWCDKQNITLICTQLEFKNQKLSSKFSTKNCYGIEKVNRIKNQYDLKKFQDIYVYGNSRGDKEMLELGSHTFYKYFI
jgi:phosphatidylglycerophosphatase C